MSDAKSILRRSMRAAMRAREGGVAGAGDAALNRRLLGMRELVDGECLSAYMAIGFEPDLKVLLAAWLAAGKRLFLPRSEDGEGGYSLVRVSDPGADLVVGRHGIQEPRRELPAAGSGGELEGLVWLVPGLAFSLRGTRLGRGGGCYDRLLARHPGFRIGVCRERQLLGGELDQASEAHDVPMDAVVTEDRFWYCRRTAGK